MYSPHRRVELARPQSLQREPRPIVARQSRQRVGIGPPGTRTPGTPHLLPHLREWVLYSHVNSLRLFNVGFVCLQSVAAYHLLHALRLHVGCHGDVGNAAGLQRQLHLRDFRVVDAQRFA